jgi:hypothetical protein
VAISLKPPLNGPIPDVPAIIGTGFVVDEGLVATNDHVVQIAERITSQGGRPAGEWPLEVTYFHLAPDRGMCQLTMEVIGAFAIGNVNPNGPYYGPKQPDIGFLHVAMKGLPRLEIATDDDAIEPGVRVATAGFPMGTRALRAPGYVHQLTPTLQEGIVSAILPFPCKGHHAIMLNIMSLTGASGSPIFLAHDPKVVGILYGGLQETYRFGNQGGALEYPIPTNFTYCVPSHYVRKALDGIRGRPELALPPDAPTLQDALNSPLQG